MHPVHPVIPAGLSRRRSLVLAWTGHFFGEDFFDPVIVPDPGGEDVVLEFTTDRNRLDEADAVWFHGPHLAELPPKRSTQPWILMSMESHANYPKLAVAEADGRFDIVMTYRLDSDVPCVYPSWREFGDFKEMSRRPAAESRFALYVASNPVPQRDAIVRALINRVPVDCPGRVLNNCRFEDIAPGSGERGELVPMQSIISRYRFYLAFENSVCEDYVTEKVFRALACGAVPIYLGAPNVREFMPSDDAVITVDDFETIEDLAGYIAYLREDEVAYRKHLAWKAGELSERFRRLLDLGNVDSRQRLAVKLAHGCDKDCDCGGRFRTWL